MTKKKVPVKKLTLEEEKNTEVPLVPSIPDLSKPTKAIPAQAAVEAQPATPATATAPSQTAQPAQPATPAIPAKGKFKIPWGVIGLAVLAGVVGFVSGQATETAMLLEFMTSKFFFLIPISIGVLYFWWIIRWMSMSNGVKWAEVWDELRKGNMAVAAYYSSRILAVAIIVVGLASAGTSV